MKTYDCQSPPKLQKIADLEAEVARLKADRLEFICWISDESQIVSGCRDDYERGRYDALRQAIDVEKLMREIST